MGPRGLHLPLEDVVGAARSRGEPSEGLVEGVVRGFLREADADAALIETRLGAGALSEFLPGGHHNCAHGDDRDLGPDGSRGWYVYLNFTAEAAALTPR